MPDDAEATLTARLPADLLRHARAVARSRDENLSQVVRRALRAYVQVGPAQLDLEDALNATKRVGGKAGRRTTTN